jgi:hypothetical protein
MLTAISLELCVMYLEQAPVDGGLIIHERISISIATVLAFRLGRSQQTCAGDLTESAKIGTLGCGDLFLVFLLVGWDFWYCGHYWPIVPAPDDR